MNRWLMKFMILAHLILLHIKIYLFLKSTDMLYFSLRVLKKKPPQQLNWFWLAHSSYSHINIEELQTNSENPSFDFDIPKYSQVSPPHTTPAQEPHVKHIEDPNSLSLNSVSSAMNAIGDEIRGLWADHLSSTLDRELFKTEVNSHITEVLGVININFGKISDMMIHMRSTAYLTCKIFQA